jgi:HEAT repeat protein
MLLDHKDKYVRLRVAGILGVLGRGGEKPLEVVLELLTDADVVLQGQAEVTLGKLGMAAVPPLIRLLGHKDGSVRVAASGACIGVMDELQGTGQEYPRELLRSFGTALSDSEPKVVTKAMICLGIATSRAKRYVPGITKCLRHSDPWVRTVAARSLAHFGEDAKTAIPALRQALMDSDLGVQDAAQKALNELEK